jgi:hypothetical protein
MTGEGGWVAEVSPEMRNIATALIRRALRATFSRQRGRRERPVIARSASDVAIQNPDMLPVCVLATRTIADNEQAPVRWIASLRSQ